MSVTRLSYQDLKKILNGKVKEPVTCVIKFYSNKCHYCTALHDYYQEIATKNEDVHFFAFNTLDADRLESHIKINGVPTIALVKTGNRKPRIRLLEDPGTPHEKTWYWSKDIQAFIDGNR